MKGEVSGILYVVILYGRPKCKDSSLLQTSRLNATLPLAPAPCTCPDTLQLCFILSPGGNVGRQHTALQTFLLCVFRSHQTRSLSLWLSSGRRGWEGCIPNLLKQKRKTAVTSRKESDWNEANQQSVMNSFSLQALFPSPRKENKTKQDTCTLPHKWRGKQSHRRLLR